ncbi:hypothetical protein LCGC14_1339310 [marine sediment metagenome]|uniref:Uncharacterized protein n=1 Tax=marine sediment metagenome TaxID=412755 RepID=A0A0F9MV29_9ZZZZ
MKQHRVEPFTWNRGRRPFAEQAAELRTGVIVLTDPPEDDDRGAFAMEIRTLNLDDLAPYVPAQED